MGLKSTVTQCASQEIIKKHYGFDFLELRTLRFIPLISSMALKATVRPKWVRPITNKFLSEFGLGRGYTFISGDSAKVASFSENKRSHTGINECYRGVIFIKQEPYKLTLL